jgi:hypothetical protein
MTISNCKWMWRRIWKGGQNFLDGYFDFCGECSRSVSMYRVDVLAIITILCVFVYVVMIEDDG